MDQFVNYRENEVFSIQPQFLSLKMEGFENILGLDKVFEAIDLLTSGSCFSNILQIVYNAQKSKFVSDNKFSELKSKLNNSC